MELNSKQSQNTGPNKSFDKKVIIKRTFYDLFLKTTVVELVQHVIRVVQQVFQMEKRPSHRLILIADLHPLGGLEHHGDVPHLRHELLDIVVKINSPQPGAQLVREQWPEDALHQPSDGRLPHRVPNLHRSRSGGNWSMEQLWEILENGEWRSNRIVLSGREKKWERERERAIGRSKKWLGRTWCMAMASPLSSVKYFISSWGMALYFAERGLSA